MMAVGLPRAMVNSVKCGTVFVLKIHATTDFVGVTYVMNRLSSPFFPSKTFLIPTFTCSWLTISLAIFAGVPKHTMTCLDLLNAGYKTSGMYWVRPLGKVPFLGYCDMESYGGGWLVCYTTDGPVRKYLFTPLFSGLTLHMPPPPLTGRHCTRVPLRWCLPLPNCWISI